MPATALRPDPLDLDILRELYRSSTFNLTGIDPRLNATRIARRLRVGRSRVAARLRAWSESGFLLRYDVWLNPHLLGMQGAWLAVQVDHPRAKSALIARLGLLEGAVSALELIGEWVSFGVVTADAAALERTVGLVRGLAGVRGVEPPVTWQSVPPRRPLTPLDIRIVRALREQPSATLGEIARRVGISARTMTRRYSDLVDTGAVWFVPVFDFRAISYPVVSVGVTLGPGVTLDRVLRQVRTRFPLTLEFRVAASDPGVGPVAGIFFVLPPSAANLEELDLFLGTIAGVEGHESNVMVRMHPFPEWFDRRLAALLPPPARTARPAGPGRAIARD